jgi:hypothetical protein
MKRLHSFVFATLLFAGCGGAPQQQPASPGAATSQPPAPAAERPPGEDDLRLELLDAGAQPRAPLRYKFHVGQQERMLMDMQMDMTTNLPGQKNVTVAMPTMQFAAKLESKSLTPEGDLVFGFVNDKVDLLDDRPMRPEIRDKVRAEIQKILGLKGEGVVTTRGLTKRADYEVPPGASPQVAQTLENMRQSLRQLATPLPLEPVGVGAKWKTTSTIRSKMFNFVQVATFSLASVKDGRATLQVQIEQKAPVQAVKMDGVPPDVKTTLDSYQGRGSGRPTVDFDRLIPTKAESEVEIHVHFKLEQGAESADVGNDLKLRLKVRSN